MELSWATLLDPPHQQHDEPLILAPADLALADDDELRCGYSSKKCFHVRTTKKGGGLHRFCEFHRRRANTNQWRVDNKRRAVRAQRRHQLKQVRTTHVTRARSTTTAVAATTRHDPLRRDTDHLLRVELALSDDEISLLQALLFDQPPVGMDAACCGLVQRVDASSCVGGFLL